MHRSSQRRVSRLLALPLVLALAAPSTAYAQDPLEKAKVLYSEGSSLYSAADYNGAIEQFTAALKIVTSEGTDGDNAIRGALLLNIAQSHVHAYEVDADVGHLRTARAIYKRFVDEADRGAGYREDDVTDAKAESEKLEAQLAEIKAENAASNESSSGGGAPPQRRDDGPKEAEIVKQRLIGGVLVGVGSAITLAGIGIVILGSTYRPFALDSIKQEEPGVPIDELSPDAQEHLDQQTQFGRWVMTGGALTAAVGVVPIVLGAIKMSRAKKMKLQAEKTALVPVFTRDFTGLSLSGRF